MATRAVPTRITWDQVAAFRLSRHCLMKRAPTRALVRVLGAMGGAQAQILSAAYMSLWARVRDLRIDEVHAAAERRDFARAWCMRRTLHLVPSDQLAVFVRGTAGRAEREVRWVHSRGASEGDIEGLIDAALDTLDTPLTGPELLDRLSRSLGVPMRSVRWGGWGNRAKIPGIAVGRVTLPVRGLLQLVGARGVVCSGPVRGGQPTFVRADAWIPRWCDMPREDAEDALLRLYLRAFGPATAADFRQWTGMALSRALAIWRRQETDIAPVTVDGWAAGIFRDDLRRLKAGRTEALPVRLLPYFDSYLLGHKARQHLVPPRLHRTVYRPAGWIAPVVLVGGRVAGVWAYARDGGDLLVRITKFAAMPRATLAAVRDEAAQLRRFLGGGGVRIQMV